MEQNPLYFDGSIQIDYATNEELTETKSFEITDEIRSKMSGNPYTF
ncbi:hypothetical protein [Ectobacillus sp. sgz5001026]